MTCPVAKLVLAYSTTCILSPLVTSSQLLDDNDNEFEISPSDEEKLSKSNVVKMNREFIVGGSSAASELAGTERIGIEANHTHICKFDHADSPGYKAVTGALLQYSLQAPHTIAGS